MAAPNRAPFFSRMVICDDPPATLANDPLIAHQRGATENAMTHICRRYLQTRNDRLVEILEDPSYYYTMRLEAVPNLSLPLSSISEQSSSHCPCPEMCSGPVTLTAGGYADGEPGEPTESSTTSKNADQSDRSVSEREPAGVPLARLDAKGKNNQQGPDEEPPPEDEPILTRTFNPYDHLKSIREVNEAIKAELLKAHPSSEGYIYGFLHPRSLVRMGTGPPLETQVIKIGRTINVQRRMRQWKKQCKYEPRVVLTQKMLHHHRIERIVHHQIHNSRLRELHCPGCGFQHNEWFRVSTIYAGHLVDMWQNFTQRQPYGQLGALLPEWLQRLERVDLEDPGCWMWFILGPPLSVEPALGNEHAE